MQSFQTLAQELLNKIVEWSTSPAFYVQAGIAITAFLLAYWVVAPFLRRSPLLKGVSGVVQTSWIVHLITAMTLIISPISAIALLGIGRQIAMDMVQQNWLLKIAQSLSVVFLLYMLIQRYVETRFIRLLLSWVGIPLAVLRIFGWLDDVTAALDSIALQMGDIRLSALVIARVLFFGSILFWLGQRSNNYGQKYIRSNATLDIGTKELFAKLFEVGIYVVLCVVLLQVVGINLTTLAVFGGALGVGLGFGLQQVASNFISGIIILLDRSIRVGDHIELDGRDLGILKEIKMRYSVIESYEGKELMVPNETFITNTFINWSHKDDKQRYNFTFAVSYSSDLEILLPLIRDTVSRHPQVIGGKGVPEAEQPDAEIDDFADSGIVILVEFWMHGVDDGNNRVVADLRFDIWKMLKENGFSMPFPQREVRILNADEAMSLLNR